MKRLLLFVVLFFLTISGNSQALFWGHSPPPVAPPVLGSPIEFVRNTSTSGGTITITLTNAIPAGSFIAIPVASNVTADTVNTGADSVGGNTWVVGANAAGSFGDPITCSVAYVNKTVANLPIGTIITLTMGYSGGASTRSYSGNYATGSTAGDTTRVTAIAGSTTWAASATVAANSVQVGYVFGLVASAGNTMSGTSWNVIGNSYVSGNYRMYFISKTTSGAGAVDPGTGATWVSSADIISGWVSVK